MAMLEVKDLNVFYGNIHAIKGVSLHVNQGEIVSLIGANGAGKTTILQTISGLIRAKSGQILFEGEDITLRYPGGVVVGQQVKIALHPGLLRGEKALQSRGQLDASVLSAIDSTQHPQLFYSDRKSVV